VVSQAGDFIQLLAQNWLVVDLTHEAGKVGTVAFMQALPRMLIGVLAGVVVDRVDRRKLLAVTQALALCQTVAFWVLLRAGAVTYGRLLVLAFALGALDSLNLTARQAVMPSLVPRELIPKAVALQALGINLNQLLAPALGGLLLASFGVQGCLVTNALSFLALLGSLAALAPLPRPAQGNRSLGDELREGVAFVRGQPALWVPIVLAWSLGLVGMPLARLLPLYSRVVLGTTEHWYGLLAAAPGVGAVLASVAVTARADPRALPRNIVLAGVAFSLALVAFGARQWLPWAYALLVCFGGAQMAFRSAISTQLQLLTPDRLRGRVTSILALDFGLWSLGAVALGAVADRVSLVRARALGADPTHLTAGLQGYGLRLVFTAAGLACLGMVLLGAWGLRTAQRRSEG
jgi:MFS family permease